MVKIAPSLAAAPLTHLAETVQTLEQSGADTIHFDIEDGHFVPEMNLGIRMIRELRPLTKLPFDVHLMVSNPEWLIPKLAEMGADHVSVHYEACPYPRRTLGIISEYNMQAGLAFNPQTPLPDLSFCLPFLKFILILTTEPEIETCSYLPGILEKVSRGKKQIELEHILWEVDGGFSSNNIEDAKAVGADIVVVGRGVFGDGNIGKNIKELKEKYERG